MIRKHNTGVVVVTEAAVVLNYPPAGFSLLFVELIADAMGAADCAGTRVRT